MTTKAGDDKLWTLMAGLTMICVGACASDAPPDENVRIDHQPFGVVSCSTATADVVLASSGGTDTIGGSPPPPAFGGLGGQTSPESISPSSYNTCYRGFVVDIPNLNPIFGGARTTPGGRDGRIVTTWHGPTPTTQQACEAAWSGAVVYKWVGDAWVDQTGAVDDFGHWVSGSCVPPGFASDLHGVVLEAHASYRLAATMRAAYGSSIRYPIGYSTQVPK